jgi:hypothetical protein
MRIDHMAIMLSTQEFLRSNINCIVPEPISSFHDDMLRRYGATGRGAVINEQLAVFAIGRSGNVFPIALFVRGGMDGVSVVSIIQAIAARDHFILCSGASHVLTGLSQGAANAFGAAGSGVGERT